MVHSLSLLGFSAAALGLWTAAAPAFAVPGQSSDIDNYVGAGIRAGLNDPPALVLDSKLQVLENGDWGLSARPAVLIGDDIEGRLPLSVDWIMDSQFLLFGGGGIAYGDDVNPMVTAGLDMALDNNLVINLEGNLIFKSSADDTDAEIAATVNWTF